MAKVKLFAAVFNVPNLQGTGHKEIASSWNLIVNSLSIVQGNASIA